MKLIEFFGMPRAGKTEQISKLSKYLNENNVSHLIITDREIEKGVNIPLEAAFEYNLIFFNKILEKMVSAKYENKYDLIILDRGFLDSGVWFEIEYKQNNLSNSERKIAYQYFRKLREYIDFGIFMIVEPETTLKRHQNKGEIGLTDDYVLQNYIENLYKEYLQLKERLKNNKRILLLDGKENSEWIHFKIKNKLKQEKIIP